MSFTTSAPIDPFAVLTGVSRILAGSLDYETTLTAIARLALPYLGSWCVVDVCADDGTMRRLAIIHPDPAQQALARELKDEWPPERSDPLGAPAVMLSRSTVVIPDVDDELLVRVARTPAALRTLRALGIGTVITVPLVARDVVLGAMTFVSATSGHKYDKRDTVLAEDLAALAALALDNARLHRESLGRAEAEAANRAKSDFLAMMSHEIRTPINAILGYAELMELGLAGPVSTQQRDFLNRLRLSGTHLIGLVSEVLDLAKVEAGQLPVARAHGMTGIAIAEGLALLRAQAQSNGVALVDANAERPDSAGGVPYVGDEHRVRQILLNLVANAIKFTGRGGTVTVSSGTIESAPSETSLLGEGPWAFIRIADTGIGIPVTQQTTVFEPFVQGEGGLTRTKGGTGLGLTISRRLARLMGGDVTLESMPGEGATFTLWLPAVVELPEGAVGVTENMDARLARALQTGGGYRAYGLAEIGTHVRRRVEDVLESMAARLRSDRMFPDAARLSRSELEDHQLAFLTDVVQSLVVIDETGGVGSALYRDGSEIQRVVAGLHGRMRHRQGWTEAQLERESEIMAEEVEALIHRHVPEDVGDVMAALHVMRHLLEQGRVISVQAYRHATMVGAA